LNKELNLDMRPLPRRKEKAKPTKPKRSQKLSFDPESQTPPPEQFAVVDEANAPPAPAVLAAATATALMHGDFTPAIACAKAVLEARDADLDPWAASMLALLTALAGRSEARNAARAWLPVAFDGRVEACFEQMLSLIHQQNIQIAELWRIAADFV